MSKSLSNIMTVFKVARIVAKVVFILCIVGGVGCVLGIITLPMVGDLLSSPMAEAGMEAVAAIPACIVGGITCAGEAVLAFLAERYFANVLSVQTPFTEAGAKECFRLGVASLIASVAISVVGGIVVAIAMLASPGMAETDVGGAISLTEGLFFMFLSLIFRYGAELTAQQEEKEEQTEQLAEHET